MKKQKHKGISLLLLIPILLIFAGVLLVKVFDLTGNIITPPCGGGSLLAKFYVYGSKTSEPNQDDALNDVQVRLQPANKDCMYTGKTSKDGYLELNRIVPGNYKLTVTQKDINKGKTLCDVYKDNVNIEEDSEYTIVLTNCNNHAFNI